MTRYEDPKAVLGRIFTANVYAMIKYYRFRVLERDNHTDPSPLRRASMSERKQRLHDPSASVDDLLRHFGIPQRRDFLCSRFVRWLSRRSLPSSTQAPSSTQRQVHHAKNIMTLAEVFCEQNPDGGAGYSFGALLERYLFFTSFTTI